jgi:hypothetical protein
MIGQEHRREYLADTNLLNVLQAPVEITTEATGERLLLLQHGTDSYIMQT